MSTQTLIGYEGGFLLCDSVQDASIETEGEFTEHPIDDGSVITDHFIRKPDRISLTLTKSDTPIYVEDGFSVQAQNLEVRSVTYGRQRTQLDIRAKRGVTLNVNAAITAGFKALAGAALPSSIDGLKVQPASVRGLAVSVLAADAPVDRIHDFYSKLLELWQNVTPITLTFKGYSYPNYILEAVTKSDKPGEFGRSTFPIRLKRIRTVATKQTTLPAVPAAKAKKDRGNKNGTEQTPEQKQELTSTLFDLKQAVL